MAFEKFFNALLLLFFIPIVMLFMYLLWNGGTNPEWFVCFWAMFTIGSCYVEINQVKYSPFSENEKYYLSSHQNDSLP